MYSKNIFFGRKVVEMGNYYKNQLYNTIISFCKEISSTSLNDNEMRFNIVEKYYGKKRDDESIEQYLHNFREDVFNPISTYYCFYSHCKK